MRKILLPLIAICFILLNGGCSGIQSGRQVLLVLNTTNPESIKPMQFLVPYLDHFGIPFDMTNIAKEKFPVNLSNYSVIILSHKDLSTGNETLRRDLLGTIRRSMVRGTGILSFDPLFFSDTNTVKSVAYTDSLFFLSSDHYITGCHSPDSPLRLFDTLELPGYTNISGNIIVSAGRVPFVWTDSAEQGRVVTWATDEWMETRILGPLGGLDDCLWRSIVWVARKPFVMRGLPPLVTMRVDDVAGRGNLWHKSPLYWIATCNKYGFKPWLGLFIYNLTPEAVAELRGFITKGNATAAPHAFGRPPRTNIGLLDIKVYGEIADNGLYAGFYYNPKAIELRETEYDEFIYFDHQHYKPWSDEEAVRGLEAVDRWYNENAPLPKSNYFIAHWYEMGSNVIDHVSRVWGMEFIAQNKAVDKPWHDTVPWIRQGPFRLHEHPGTSTNHPDRKLRGTNPVYYADFTDINGNSFFNCYTEIRDDAGYEWAPDNDVEASAGRGIRQLRRALNSMALPVLFTHETDYIFRISPENWEKQLQIISDGIRMYDPIFMTSDQALKIVRATKTSSIDKVIIKRKQVETYFTGKTDVTSYFYLFKEKKNSIQKELLEVPLFNGLTIVKTVIN